MAEKFTVGFAGIGMMGTPMALCLAKAGWPVQAYDVNRAALDVLSGQDGITIADSPAEAVRGASLVITMLPDGKIVRDAVLGPDQSIHGGLAAAMEPGSVLADMSTSYPLETTSLAEALEGSNVTLIDAPVSGGVWRAELGKLTIMAGGDAAAIDRVEPALSAMGTVFRCGKLGAGHAMKVLNNYLSASGLAAACEAVLIGKRFGLDPDVMADVFNVSTGRNNATDVKLKQHINNEAYSAGFTMRLMAKDLRMAAALAEDMAARADGLIACRDLYNRAEDMLGGKADHTEVMRIIAGDS